MDKKIVRHFGHIAFVIYLCLSVLIPTTHCHAVEVSSENTTCKTLPSVVQCCELHESDHTNSDEHHIHFLTDDQITATRNNPTDTSLAPQVSASIDEFFLKPYYQVVGIVDSIAYIYQEALRPYFSGLSPPLS